MARTHRPTPNILALLQARFLFILPKIECHGRCVFRHLKCWHTKEDRIAETVAISWKWFLRLVEQGKDPCQFPTVIASYAAKAVKSGRRLCGQLKSKDVLSELAQQRHGFYVGKIPDFSTESTNPLVEALTENTVSEVPDQVCFRIDYPAWLRTMDQKKRRITNAMALGHRTLDLSHRFKLSQGRISQLRQELRQSWLEFIDEETIPPQQKPAA
jgi:hypothetical protein